MLDFGEFVHAIGIGNLGGKMGIVTLTDRRLIFRENLVEFALASIRAISLGKKMGGETLTISHSGTSATITTLQHGQGDAIARNFREIKDQPSATTTPAAADPIEQIERLAGLRDKASSAGTSSRHRRCSSSAASRDHRARRKRCGERVPESGAVMSSVGDAPDEGAAGEIALTIEQESEAAAPLLLFLLQELYGLNSMVQEILAVVPADAR